VLHCGGAQGISRASAEKNGCAPSDLFLKEKNGVGPPKRETLLRQCLAARCPAFWCREFGLQGQIGSASESAATHPAREDITGTNLPENLPNQFD